MSNSKIVEVEGGFMKKEYDKDGSVISKSDVFPTAEEAEAGELAETEEVVEETPEEEADKPEEESTPSEGADKAPEEGESTEETSEEDNKVDTADVAPEGDQSVDGGATPQEGDAAQA